MKVGDLIRDRDYSEVGLIVGYAEHDEMFRTTTPCYAILTPIGSVEWFEKEYVEAECEIISESR